MAPILCDGCTVAQFTTSQTAALINFSIRTFLSCALIAKAINFLALTECSYHCLKFEQLYNVLMRTQSLENGNPSKEICYLAHFFI